MAQTRTRGTSRPKVRTGSITRRGGTTTRHGTTGRRTTARRTTARMSTRRAGSRTGQTRRRTMPGRTGMGVDMGGEMGMQQ